jgi:3-oxoacyl-[acyl-carrier protein] reductase
LFRGRGTAVLQGKVALVTGASRGIGREISLLLAKNGAKVVAADVLLEGAEETARLAGNGSYAVKLDVSNAEEVQKVVGDIADKEEKIDILVNNAGITRDNLLIGIRDEDWEKVLDVNLKGTFLMTRAVVRQMMRARAGSIISLSSVSGLHGNVGQANYAASKAGIVGLTKTVAREFAKRGIRANAVAPGFIKTEMTDVLSDKVKEAALDAIPMRRFGEPLDIAKAVLFLASDLSAYITGQVIVVDGGMGM